MAISFKNVGIKKDNILFDQALNPQPIGIKTPLEINTNGFGPFQAIYDPVKQLKDNLRNLISTNNGERLGRYNYGANLRSLAFDLASKDDFDAEVAFRIKDSVRRYMPMIELDELETTPLKITKIDDSNKSIAKILIKVKFNVPKARTFDEIVEVIIYAGG